MAKRRGRRKRSPAATGCAVLIVAIIVIGILLIPPKPKSTTDNAPTSNPATKDALQSEQKLEPSATITDTPIATLEENIASTPTISARPVKQDDMTAFSLTSYYVRNTANVRTCPDTQCESLGKVETGQTITVDGAGRGGDVNGSSVWVRTVYNGQVGYIHGSLVIESSLVSQPQQVQSQPQSGNPLINVCNGQNDLNCDDFSGGGADSHLKACGSDEDRLDADGDQDACEPGFD